MTSNKCLFCGSNNLRADRALSGRLVCTNCGNPYGVRKAGRNKLNDLNTFSFNKKYWIFICILVVSFLLCIKRLIPRIKNTIPEITLSVNAGIRLAIDPPANAPKRVANIRAIDEPINTAKGLFVVLLRVMAVN